MSGFLTRGPSGLDSHPWSWCFRGSDVLGSPGSLEKGVWASPRRSGLVAGQRGCQALDTPSPLQKVVVGRARQVALGMLLAMPAAQVGVPGLVS